MSADVRAPGRALATAPGGAATGDVRAALARLGVERLVLSIHQSSFPASEDDVGHGAPASRRGLDFLRFAAALGFTGVGLGPAGITTPANRSPYDGTLFSRDPLSISLAPLAGPAWGGLLDPALLEAAVTGRPGDGKRVVYGYAHTAQHGLLAALHRAARGRPDAAPDLPARLEALRDASPWLPAEARFEATAAAVGHDDPTRWPAWAPSSPEAAERFELAQLAAAEQHRAFAAEARAQGLALYADAQIGMGHRDRHLYRSLLLPGYAMGAPPSRTNPEGQPWEYPVLDPRQWGPDGAARRFVERRFDALFAEHDGVRIDHPHGWVCPWVYRAGAPSPLAAVQEGARLFESPDLPDHPDLAAFARVRPEQIERSVPRYDDAWVKWLEPAQIDAFASWMDVLVAAARARGRGPADLLVEVLSTCPRPLAAVLARHGLGRFRVTQKARVAVRDDVYRGDNAHPEDWIMVGNHDTPPLAAVVERLARAGEAGARAGYLAERLTPPGGDRGAVAAHLAEDRRALAEAMLAELFVGPARNVLVFWPDLFGMTEVYNRPGVVSEDNWVLRVPPDFEAEHARAVASGRAPSLPRALALALRARGLDRDAEGAALAARLEAPVR